MEERQVSVDGKSHALPAPFFVVATQNPIEMEGTYSLPEAQLDRFLMRVSLGYPNADEELRILEAQVHDHPIEQLRPVLDVKDLRTLQLKVRSVSIARESSNTSSLSRVRRES